MQSSVSKPNSSSSTQISTSEPQASTSGPQVSTSLGRPLPKGILKRTRPVTAEGDSSPDEHKPAETARKTVTFAEHEEIRYLTPPLSRSTSQASSNHSNKSQAGDDLASRSDSPSSSPSSSPPLRSKMGGGISKIPLFAPRSPSNSPEPEPELELRRGETPISPVKPAVIPFWEKATPPISRTYGKKGKSVAISAASSRTVSAPSSPKRPPSEHEDPKNAEKQKLAIPTEDVEMTTFPDKAQEAKAVVAAAPSSAKPPSTPKARPRPVPTATAKAARSQESSSAIPFSPTETSVVHPRLDFSPELPEPAPRRTPASTRSRLPHHSADFPSRPSTRSKPVSLDATPSSSSKKRKHEAMKPRSEGSTSPSVHIPRNEDVRSNTSTPAPSNGRAKRGFVPPSPSNMHAVSPYREPSGSGSEEDVDEDKSKSSRIGTGRKRRKTDEEADGEYRPPSSSNTPRKARFTEQDDEQGSAQGAERQQKPPSMGVTPLPRRSGRHSRANSEARESEDGKQGDTPVTTSSTGGFSSDDFVNKTKAALRPKTLARTYTTLNERNKPASVQLYSRRRQGKSVPETPRKSAFSDGREAISAPTSSSKPSSSARQKQIVESDSDSSSQGAYEVATSRSRAGTPGDKSKWQDDAISVGSTVTLQGDPSRTRAGTEELPSSVDHPIVQWSLEPVVTTQGEDTVLVAMGEREASQPVIISVVGDQSETTTADHVPRAFTSLDQGIATCAAEVLNSDGADIMAIDPVTSASLDAAVMSLVEDSASDSSSFQLGEDRATSPQQHVSPMEDSHNNLNGRDAPSSSNVHVSSMPMPNQPEIEAYYQESALPVKAEETKFVTENNTVRAAMTSPLSAQEASKMAAPPGDEDEGAEGLRATCAEARTGGVLISHEAHRGELKDFEATLGDAEAALEEPPSADSDMDISDGPVPNITEIATNSEVLTVTPLSTSPPRRSASGPLRSARPKRGLSKPFGKHKRHFVRSKESSEQLKGDIKAPVSDSRSGYDASRSSGRAGSSETAKVEQEEPPMAAFLAYKSHELPAYERDSSGSPVKALDPDLLPREGLSKTQRRYKAERWTQEQRKLEDSMYVNPEDGARSRKPSSSLAGLSYGSEMSAVPDSEISEVEELDTTRFDVLQDAIDLHVPGQVQNYTTRSTAPPSPGMPNPKANFSRVSLKEPAEHLTERIDDEIMVPTSPLLSSAPLPSSETKEAFYPPDMQRAQPDRIFKASPNEFGCHDYPAESDRRTDKSKSQVIPDIFSTTRASDEPLQNIGQRGAPTERLDTDASAILAACKEGGVRFPIECEDDEVVQPLDDISKTAILPREVDKTDQPSLSSSPINEFRQDTTKPMASTTGVAQSVQAKAIPRGLDSLLQRGLARRKKIDASKARNTKATRSKTGQTSGSQLSASSPLSTQTSEVSVKSASSERGPESRRPPYKTTSNLAALHSFAGWTYDQGDGQQPSSQPATATATATAFTGSKSIPRRMPSQKTATSFDTRLSVKPGLSGSNVIEHQTPATGADEDGLPPPLRKQRTGSKDTVNSEKKVLSLSSRRAVQSPTKKNKGSASARTLPKLSPVPLDRVEVQTRNDTAVEQATPSDPKRHDAKLRPVIAARPPSSKRKLLTDDGEDLPGE